MKQLFWIFCLCLPVFGFSQDAQILFNQLNLNVYNPAFTGVEGPMVTLNSRLQWVGIKDAPRTHYFIYNFAEKNKVNLGFTVQNDRVFIENKTYLTADYNYRLTLDDEQFLFLGLKAGGFYNRLDLDKLNRLATGANPYLAAVNSYFTPILGFGAHYRVKNYFVGVGVPSLFNSKKYGDVEGVAISAYDLAYLHLSSGGSWAVNEDFAINSSLIYRGLRNSPDLLSGTLELEFQQKISLGFGAASNDNMAAYVLFKNYKNLSWGYGYEFMNRNDPTAIQGGSHEISVRFALASKPSFTVESNNAETSQ